MTRRRVQLDISTRVPRVGRTIHRWPVSLFCSISSPEAHVGLYGTIADIVQARRPQFGALYLVALADISAGPPSYAEIIEKGSYALIGNYKSAAERAALLEGERIEDGQQKQSETD